MPLSIMIGLILLSFRKLVILIARYRWVIGLTIIYQFGDSENNTVKKEYNHYSLLFYIEKLLCPI